MARARKRYEVIGNMASNGVSLQGQRLILMGECSWHGSTKSKDGKKLPSRELTSLRFRYEDQKWAKNSKVIKGEVVVDKKHLNTFLRLIDE